MHSVLTWCILVVLPFLIGGTHINDYDPRYGTYVGSLKTLMHRVKGEVYALDDITILIRGFSYDGEAPDALFFAGNNGKRPSHRGFVIPDEKGSIYPLSPYNNRDIILRFPVTRKGQRSFHDIKWISVWCRKFAIDFGHVMLPKKMQVPSAFKGGAMKSDRNEVQAVNVIMKDTDTFELEGFKFDGTIDDAIFVMGSGARNEDGFQVTDERGSTKPLKRMTKNKLTLKVPESARGKHIQYFGVWSPSRGMLSSVTFPNDMRVPPSIRK